uniref:RING-type E3 ubiquitin transferase n=1 Tax=Anisakis simplex TaxID=6269 RepID=A0A0M3JSU2_ANISI
LKTPAACCFSSNISGAGRIAAAGGGNSNLALNGRGGERREGFGLGCLSASTAGIGSGLALRNETAINNRSVYDDCYELTAGSCTVLPDALTASDFYSLSSTSSSSTSNYHSTKPLLSSSRLANVANRSRSVGPVSILDNCYLLIVYRQHRSFDGMELLGSSYETSDWPSTAAAAGAGTLPPLQIPSASGTHVMQTNVPAPPLSNPTSSNAQFWKHQQAMMNMSRNERVLAYPAATSSANDTAALREYDLLKRDYENALQKLNSTMSSIKTFWSPELKRERQLRKEETAKVALLQRQLTSASNTAQQTTGVVAGGLVAPAINEYRLAELEGELENSHIELMKKDETIRRLIERQSNTATNAGSARFGASLNDAAGTLTGASATRLAELETTCNQLESLISIRDQQLRSLEQQLNSLQQQQQQQSGGISAAFSNAQRENAKVVLLCSLLSSRKEHFCWCHLLDRRIADLEEELATLRTRCGGLDPPRDFTDKSVTSHELHTLRMKMERSEMELAKKSSDLATTQTRLQAASEENADLRKHLEVLRDSSSSKEQHATLLQSDIEALRAKLENKNAQIDQKEKLCERIESELKLTKGQLADMRETNKGCEQRMSQLVARLDALERVGREREQELDKMKHKLLAQPDVQMERQMQLQIDEANREKKHLQCVIDDLRRNAEKEKAQQLETFQEQNRQLTATIESLQKELSDRQVLLESQNEKIGDLDRELCSVERQRKEQTPQLTNDEQLAEARKEIDSLLRMVQTLEKDKSSLLSQCKQLQRSVCLIIRFPLSASNALEEVNKEGTTMPATGASTSSAHRTDTLTLSTNGTLKNRVEELEEALRESVSITAERELHVAQQKQLNQQLALQLSESRREIAELRKMIKELSNGDREEMVRSFEVERRKHIEQLLQLKHEALVAAIAEKDAHIALLEQSHERPRDEIETLRTHKEKLIEKLKEENERRIQLVNSTSMNVAPGAPIQQQPSGVGSSTTLAAGVNGAFVGAGVPGSAPIAIASSSLPNPTSNVDQEDDAEGIWA